MEPGTLAAALEREHREIDRGVDGFLEGTGAEPLRLAIDALRRHIYLEEAFLFPPLRAAGMVAPVAVMLREHGELWRTLRELDEALAAGGAETPVRALCRQLLAQLERHNAKEEPILYPHADTVLDETASGELQAFLAEGRTPPGWVCAGAAAAS